MGVDGYVTGDTGESSVQAATFDWQKKAAAAAFVGGTNAVATSSTTALASLPPSPYIADVGYFADGTSIVKAGNQNNHGGNTAPDPHTNGQPLPVSPYIADVGYFSDGTSIVKAGNQN